MRICDVDECESTTVGNGLCRKHYMRMRRKGSTDDARKNARGGCARDGCERPHRAHGVCHMHRQVDRRSKATREAKEREPRVCSFCGAPIDPSKRRRGAVSYCTRTCKERASTASGANRVATLKSYYKRRYNLTPEQVEEMRRAGCAICGTAAGVVGRHGQLHIDHCHATGKLRGVLCSECNVGLGKFKDDPALLRRAAEYLMT